MTLTPTVLAQDAPPPAALQGESAPAAPQSETAPAAGEAPPTSSEGEAPATPLAEPDAAPPPAPASDEPAPLQSPVLNVPEEIAGGVRAWIERPAALPVPTAQELASQAEASRADAWIQAMQRKERERRVGGRWSSTIVSGAMATAAAVLLILDEPSEKAARWVLGSSIAPFVTGAALGIFLPEDHATPWATTAWALGMATAAVSVGLPWYEDETSTHREKQAVAFIGGAFATHFLTLIPLAFLDRGLGRRAYADYYGLSARDRAKAATDMLLRYDQRARAKIATLLLGGLASMAVAGIGAAITEDPLLIIGAIPALTNMVTLIPMLFRESSLEMFLQGPARRPGVYRF